MPGVGLILQRPRRWSRRSSSCMGSASSRRFRTRRFSHNWRAGNTRIRASMSAGFARSGVFKPSKSRHGATAAASILQATILWGHPWKARSLPVRGWPRQYSAILGLRRLELNDRNPVASLLGIAARKGNDVGRAREVRAHRVAQGAAAQAMQNHERALPGDGSAVEALDEPPERLLDPQSAQVAAQEGF